MEANFIGTMPLVIKNNTEFYSVLAPGTIRSQYKYDVAVSVLDAKQKCQIKIDLIGPDFNDTKTIDIEPKTTENLIFNIPQIKEGQYKLVAEGLQGILFKETRELIYAANDPLVFIQTDKAVYKPGDLVQFRVIFLNESSRPANIEKSIIVTIIDGAQNRIKQFRNLTLIKGVLTERLQLSDQPVLGAWTIEVKIDDDVIEFRQFHVDKYVLPKFDVNIETNKNVTIAEDTIKVIVRSKYTYGKGVKGKATVTVTPRENYCYRRHDSDTENSKNNLKAEKTIDMIDGKACLEFDFYKDLHLYADSGNLPNLEITASVEELLTGNKKEAENVNVTLHEERYKIEGINLPDSYKLDEKLQFKISVKTIDGAPVKDTENPIKLILDLPSNRFNNPKKRLCEFTSYLDEHGIALFDIAMPKVKIAYSYYRVKCEFLETSVELITISEYVPPNPDEHDDKQLELNILTENPILGKEVTFEVKSCDNIPYFVYSIIGRGKILKTEYIKTAENSKKHAITFEPIFDMVPDAQIFVHYIYDGKLRFANEKVSFEKNFENSIKLNAPNDAELGTDIELTIDTKPNSFVGLLGVDQSVLLLKSGNDLNKDDIFNKLNQITTRTPWAHYASIDAGRIAGLIVISNGVEPVHCVRYGRTMGFGGIQNMSYQCAQPEGMAFKCTTAAFSAPIGFIPPSAAPQVRKEFPENWIFDNIEDFEGNTVAITKKIPDTITSWIITGFSLNAEAGIAVTETPTKIQTFRPFFITTNLPYSIKRGESVTIPAILFNYLDQTLNVTVSLENNENEFDFIDKVDDETKQTKTISIDANTGETVNFIIRPKVIGFITLKVVAISPIAGDAIERTLRVEPEGITIYENTDFFICSEKGEFEVEKSLTLNIPEDAIPDSEIIEVSLMGDILSSTIANIDKLVRMPYGCGEQNMVNFVPNILVLKYLETLGKLNESIEKKAKSFLEIGYQRELTYKHNDGSYSAFGISDKNGSTWLTAYVVRSFHEAANYIDIDSKIIKQGLDFLAKSQNENGEFIEKGKLFDYQHHNKLGLSAFVMLAFLENVELLEHYRITVERGLDYILKNIETEDDLYALAIAIYALQRFKLPSVKDLLEKLEKYAKNECGLKWWVKPNEKSCNTGCYYQPKGDNVETVGYILMTLLDLGETVLPTTKWLISKRNSNGGFSSTQETVVGLQALIKFAEKIGGNDTNVSVDVHTNDEKSIKKFVVTKENAMIVQSVVVPSKTRQLTFNCKCNGVAVLQVKYHYNIQSKDAEPCFKINTKLDNIYNIAKLLLNVSVEFSGEENVQESNMAVLEVSLPSGYTADGESFEKIKKIEDVKRVETENDNTKVVVYFDSLKVGQIRNVPIEVERTYEVDGQKPVPVVIYDYYDNLKRATHFYTLNKTEE